MRPKTTTRGHNHPIKTEVLLMHVTSAVWDAYEITLLVGCLLGEWCSGQTRRLLPDFSLKLQQHLGSTHRREHDWLPRVPDMAG